MCMPIASKFNECLAIDLKIWDKVYFLVIDIATRFCQAIVINNKNAPTIIRGLFKGWISLFGGPDKLLSDCGREFNNCEMRALGEAFNIKIMTTAAESPWSNGICERLNAEIGEKVARILEEANCDLEMALAWAVSARNALGNKSGFSPNQLVFGFNPAIPDVFNSKPPALEQVTSSDIVRENLTALHLARKDFMRYEADEKIKRALKHRVRPTRVEDLTNGDNVYYKRNDSEEWRGPGIVLGREGKVVFVRHGGDFVRVHTARLVQAPTESEEANEEPTGSGVQQVETEDRDEPAVRNRAEGFSRGEGDTHHEEGGGDSLGEHQEETQEDSETNSDHSSDSREKKLENPGSKSGSRS